MRFADQSIKIERFQVGLEYSRSEIAAVGKVNAPKSSRDPHWSQGIVEFSNAILLLVTLDKTGRKNYKYDDWFRRKTFWWQSQDRQTQRSRTIGRILSGALPPYLFVRLHEKQSGITQPFVYCGCLLEPEAEGDNPVTVQFTCPDYVEDATGRLRDIYDWRPKKTPRRREKARIAKIRIRRSRGQGRQTDQEVKAATEKRATDAARKHYSARGYAIEDTHANKPYDLKVSKGPDVRHVEIKGTQGRGESVEVTSGEVNAARAGPEPTDLFILHSISVTRSYGVLNVCGGKVRLLRDWGPEKRHLRPTRFAYQVHVKTGRGRRARPRKRRVSPRGR